MKKATLTLSLFMAVVFTAFAGNANHFNFNEAEMDQALQQVEAAESFVAENPGVSYQELNQNLDVNLSATPVIGATQSEPPLGVPSWIWGACLGVAGLAIVYFVTEDKEETKQALWGCVGVTVVGLAIWLITAGTLFASASTI